MIQFNGYITKIKVTPEKKDRDGNIIQERQIEITVKAEYDGFANAEYANIALAQANEDFVGVTLDPRQLVMDLHQSITSAEDEA